MDDDPEEAGFFRVTFDEITALYFANLPRQMHSMPGSPFLRLLRCCYRKHPTRQFYKISVLGGMVSCKIVCVLTKYWESSPGKFDLKILWYFFLLENLMCSNEILDKLSWKFWCVLVHFSFPGKIICALVPFLVLLENLMCTYKRIMSSPGKLEVFLLHPSILENLMCSRNLF